MSLRVFAARPPADEPAVLDPDESHYLRRVRRAPDGAALELIDDRGALWSARVRGGDARRSEVDLLTPLVVPAPSRELVLLLGLPEPSAVLEILPGLIEIGVTTIVWTRCARSQSPPPGQARLDRVVRAAQRQCGRPNAPHFLGPHELETAASVRTDLAGYFAWEQRRGLADSLALTGGARLLVGPEGGLTPAEAELLAATGLQPLGLGPYTLRTGTAALVGLARLMFAPSPR